MGRTGRAGDKEGVAYTLVTPQETRQAAFLVNSLIAAGQNITEELHSVAMKVGSASGAQLYIVDDHLQDQRFSKGKGRKAIGKKGAGRVGGSGLGYSATSSLPPESLSDFTPSHKS